MTDVKLDMKELPEAPARLDACICTSGHTTASLPVLMSGNIRFDFPLSSAGDETIG